MKRRVIILVLSIVLLGVFFAFYFYKQPGIPAEETIPIEISNILQPQDGLPPAVEAKRQAIYRAAMSRDYENLNKETSAEFHYSFGGEYEGGFIGYLKLSETNESESAFDIIPTLLRLPYASKDNLYTWPSVFSIEPSKSHRLVCIGDSLPFQ